MGTVGDAEGLMGAARLMDEATLGCRVSLGLLLVGLSVLEKKLRRDALAARRLLSGLMPEVCWGTVGVGAAFCSGGVVRCLSGCKHSRIM